LTVHLECALGHASLDPGARMESAAPLHRPGHDGDLMRGVVRDDLPVALERLARGMHDRHAVHTRLPAWDRGEADVELARKQGHAIHSTTAARDGEELNPSHLGNRNFVGRSFHADLTPPTPLSLVERRSTLDRRPEGEGGGARGKTPPSPP